MAAISKRLLARSIQDLRGPLGVTSGIPRLALPFAASVTWQKAELVAWDFLVIGSEEAMMATAMVPRQGAAAFGGVVRGTLPDEVLTISRKATQVLGASRSAYRPYLLEASWAGMIAMVFRSDGGRFLHAEMLPSRKPQGGSVRLVGGIRSLLQTLRITARELQAHRVDAHFAIDEG
ncbi:MAG: hypothetical protein PGN12_01795 [Sphingomonas phyllosphaerae]